MKTKAIIQWHRNSGETFTDNRYSRGHHWQFDGGLTIPASSSPDVVPVPYSIAEHVDPEEAFVAAIASCHMLFFLSIAAKKGYTIDAYRDRAEGLMEKRQDGKTAMTQVTLQPDVQYGGNKRPDAGEEQAMHHESHELCFIANSVRTRIEVKLHP